MPDRMPVDGPYRIYVDSLPTGATIDVSHYLTAILLNLAHAAEEDGESLLSELVDIAELNRSAAHQGPDSHAAHQRDVQVAELLAEVADDGRIPVYGAQVMRLADRLQSIGALKSVPTQREAGAA
ncbi:hypothetical protein J7I98_23875 [Streptomyces sp. ISL-98]|uniref:hypothetical protein n=1 Tax=Streptomyces sp. ISL-98 TaxID=2819192 RepID=UPI001BE6F4D3|nr:hypothetical protein [Streptomyces sp. ISL-98]MBT2508870.1 hypothetical protein [Streptomyces sp. ISL-98]